MSILSRKAARTAFFVVALSGAGLWALHALSANAEPSPAEDSSPCAEGRALFAAKLAYLEARIAPEPGQEDAWRAFANAMRSSAANIDRACVEAHGRPAADAGEKLERMAKHAAAMEAMFDAMAQAYVAVAPNLTTAQRDILSRNIVPPPGRFGPPPHPHGPALACGPRGPEPEHGAAPPWGPAPF